MAQPEPTLDYPNTYNVTVDVRYEFEVEADNEKMAEEIGYYFEDYAMFSDVQSIDVDLVTEFCQECGADVDDPHCEEEEAE
jgi:hypothetical protein